MEGEPVTPNASICVIDGAFFDVRLQFLPHPGDLIDLHSFVDQAKNYQPFRHFYKVVQVVHLMHDIPEQGNSRNGRHDVRVYVEPITKSKFIAELG